MEKQGQNADFVKFSNIDSATLSEGFGSGPHVAACVPRASWNPLEVSQDCLGSLEEHFRRVQRRSGDVLEALR